MKKCEFWTVVTSVSLLVAISSFIMGLDTLGDLMDWDYGGGRYPGGTDTGREINWLSRKFDVLLILFLASFVGFGVGVCRLLVCRFQRRQQENSNSL